MPHKCWKMDFLLIRTFDIAFSSVHLIWNQLVCITLLCIGEVWLKKKAGMWFRMACPPQSVIDATRILWCRKWDSIAFKLYKACLAVIRSCLEGKKIPSLPHLKKIFCTSKKFIQFWMCFNTYYNGLQFSVCTSLRIWKNKILQKYNKI